MYIIFSDLSCGLLNRFKMLPQGVGTFSTIGQPILRTFIFLSFVDQIWAMAHFGLSPYGPWPIWEVPRGSQDHRAGPCSNNLCHSRTKCKFKENTTILLCVFEGQSPRRRYLQQLRAGAAPRNLPKSTGALHQTARTPTAESCLGNFAKSRFTLTTSMQFLSVTSIAHTLKVNYVSQRRGLTYDINMFAAS